MYDTKISIVTISYNNVEGLKKTIESVKKYKSKIIKYVVIDGGSEDGSLELLEKYNDNIDFWISESDRGISDAFNKGIKKCNSSFILMLNSGDELIADISYYIGYFEKFDIVSFSCIIKENSKLLKYHEGRKYIFNEADVINHSKLPHQATFVHKRVYEYIGGYDENFKLRMDLDFFMRAYLAGFKFKNVPIALTIYGADGLSSQLKNMPKYKLEEIYSLNKNYKPSKFFFVFFWMSFPVFLLKKMASRILRILKIRV